MLLATKAPTLRAPTQCLPLPVNAERRLIPHAGQRIAVYLSSACSQPRRKSETPLVLVHSVNAAASAAEVRPLFEHYAATRPVLALELPGFGSSDRGNRPYRPALMSSAILAALEHLRNLGFDRPADVMGVSLACEFVARAAHRKSGLFRSVALVSPTGLEGWRSEKFDAGRSKKRPWLLALLRLPVWSQFLFRALTTRRSLNWFLQRVWGSAAVDQGLLDYDELSARQPGARFAPLAFISGALFTHGAAGLYRQLKMPVWLAHGTRGEFSDCDGVARIDRHSRLTLESFDTGALPYFEALEAFSARYDAFVARLNSRAASVAAGLAPAHAGAG